MILAAADVTNQRKGGGLMDCIRDVRRLRLDVLNAKSGLFMQLYDEYSDTPANASADAAIQFTRKDMETDVPPPENRTLPRFLLKFGVVLEVIHP